MPDEIGHYRVKQKLGSGGMGEVYLAEDPKLHRPVALKVLPPEVANDPQRRSRFLQEAHAASLLNHPNVSTIYEVGEAGETIFIAMEYIDGKTLSQLRESRSIELDEVIDISVQLADALDEAHSRGIIHRDIKSANIMVTARGHVKVLDFGLAKLSADADPQDEDTRIKTTPGLVVGTSYYMSPEQALGRAVDARSDLFSLGVVLYELTTGKLPFVGSSTTETIEKITHSQPDPIARFNYSVPPELERIVRKLLEKEAARRYQSARELMADLKNLKRDTSSGEMATAPTVKPKRNILMATAAVIVIALALIAFMSLKGRETQPAKTAAIESIAVMPFVNTSKDPETEYLSDGISESIINNLTTISTLRVIPRSTVFRYKGKDTDLQQIAKELNVHAIVSGRVLQRGDTLSVQTELVDTQTNSQIWGARYERKTGDALALQKEISNEISDRLRQSGTNDGQPGTTRPMTANAEAFQLYLKGRYHWNKRTGESLKRALGYFQEAVKKDPSFALAHVGVADSYLLLEQYADQSHTETLKKSEEAARRALAINDQIAEAHATLGLIHQNRWEWSKSEEEFKRAIALNPNYPTARHWYNIMLRQTGRTDEAFEQVMKAQQLDPLSMIIGVNVIDVLTLLGRYDEASANAEKYAEIDPDFPQLLNVKSQLYTMTGRHAEAIAASRNGVVLSGETTEQLASLASSLAAAGERGEAKEVAARLKAKIERGQGDSYHLAPVHAALGDKDRAFAELSRAVDRKSPQAGAIKTDLRLIPLRSDPRFAALLKRMGLTPTASDQ